MLQPVNVNGLLSHSIKQVLLLCAVACVPTSKAQRLTPEPPPVTLVSEAVDFQLADLRHKDYSLRYQLHRVDAKEDSVREVIETADGNVARMLLRDGKPLTLQQASDERKRLESITPASLRRHHRGAQDSDNYGVELISALPVAMLYTRTPGQPQAAGIARPQVVLDYEANPDYKAQTVSQSLLHGLAGRMWIDAETHHLLRIEINVTHDLNLMAGILARVYSGGSVTYQQHALGNGHYAYDHIEMSLRLRELIVKNVPFHSSLTATQVVALPTRLALNDAVQMLLAAPAP